MVDNLNVNDPAAAGGDPPTEAAGLRGFINSKVGKLVIGGVLIVFLLVAVAFALLPALLGGGGDPEDVAVVPPAGSVPATVTPGADEQETVSYRRTKPLSTVFVFRNIFEPTARPVPKGTGTGAPSGGGTGGSGEPTSTGGSGSDDTPNLPKDTLFVRGISTEDGRTVATFLWNGEKFTAGEGEALGDTPWRVVSISGTSVVLLYGDSRVTLTVGQGLTK